MFAKHDCAIELRDVDLRVTPARLAALRLFEEKNEPIDSQLLVRTLQELDVDRVTAFRILNSFAEKGLIRKLEFGESKARYELATSDHHHLICQNCGKIEDISDCNISELEQEICSKKKFLVKLHTLEFYGICKMCQTN